MKLVYGSLQFAATWIILNSAYAQQSQVSFQRFNVEDGLSQGSVSAIAQDHQGFIWIGTQDGLNRFDGIDFKVYRHHPQDSTSLSSSWITCLYVDKTNVLWVGTHNGLNRFDPATESFVHYSLPPSDSVEVDYNRVCSIQESYIDGVSKLFIAMPKLQVLSSKDGTLRPILHLTDQIKADIELQVSTIIQGEDGLFWMTDGNNLLSFNPQTETMRQTYHIGPNVNLVCVLSAKLSKDLWFGGRGGMYRMNMEKRIINKQLPDDIITLIEDRNSKIWIGTETGLLRLSFDGMNKTVEKFRHDPSSTTSLSNDGIRVLFEDATGSLWIGTFNGLNRLNDFSAVFNTYRHLPRNPNSLGNDFVLPIMETKKGEIWFGTFGGGISILRNERNHENRFTHIKHDPPKAITLPDNNVRSLLQDRAGVIWIGTGKGLTRFSPTTESFTCFEKISPEDTLVFWAEALIEARNGTVWAGATARGLIKIELSHQNPGDIKFLRYPLNDKRDRAASVEVHSIVEDKKGSLWVATEAGLVRFDPKTETYTRYRHNPEDTTSLSNNIVWSILEDPIDDSTLWVGTSQGLNKFNVNTATSKRYFEQQGFPNSFVYGILRDDLGRLWMSTNHGLTCFDVRQPDRQKFKNFDMLDGVQGNEFNRHAFCRLKSGEFLFGGTHGVTRFHPLQVRNNPYPPPVILTSFSKLGKRVQFDRNICDVSVIDLVYDDYVFAFEFVALNYINASKNQYAYMMEGFDKKWNYCGTRRFASYTHLDPGEYVFRVKASNNDGVWNEKGVAVLLSISPPLWGTWWFKVLTSSSLLIGLVLFYRRRIRKLEKEKNVQQEFSLRLMESQENERKRIAGELHDSLGQDLLVIKNRTLLGLKDEEMSSNVRSQLDQISSIATQAINNVREISYDLRPYQLDRLGLTKAIASITSGLASSVQFSIDIDSIDDVVEKDHAIHVYRIVQEGINNILKHANASEAQVVIRREVNHVHIKISDNGKGMYPQPSEGKRGFGLIGIAERVKAMNGTIVIESLLPKGTMLTIVIPRKKTSV